jgi:hypothetical protein
MYFNFRRNIGLRNLASQAFYHLSHSISLVLEILEEENCTKVLPCEVASM